jgi:hypothetical protein
MAGSEPWQPLGDPGQVSEAYRVAYRQLADAEIKLDAVRARRRLSSDELDALAARQPNRSFGDVADELVSLAKVVEALGGHVEVRAVFDDETITLLCEPAPPAAT